MIRTLVYGGAVALLLATAANAGEIQTLTFSGVLSYGYDNAPTQFLLSPGSMTGDAYMVAITYDTLAFTNDSCGGGGGVSCNWNFTGNVTETITIAGKTETYTATSGNIQYNSSGGKDAIYLTASGPGGVQFGAQLITNTSLFSSQINVNDPQLLLDATNLSLLAGSGYNANFNGTSWGGTPLLLSTSLATPASQVPEPSSLLEMSTGLLVLGLLGFLRRKRTEGTGSQAA